MGTVKAIPVYHKRSKRAGEQESDTETGELDKTQVNDDTTWRPLYW
jgi:hypothetical protein